jgi:hypothetical protein
MTNAIPAPPPSSETRNPGLPGTVISKSPPRWPLAIYATWFAVAAIETVIGIAAGWPSQFMGKGDPAKVASQWISMGTLISPPLFLFAATGVGGLLAFAARRRAWRAVGGALAIVAGLVSVVATLGEFLATATPAVPRGAHWSALIGTVLSLALIAAGVAVVRGGDRRSASR